MGLFDAVGSILGFPGSSAMSSGYSQATSQIEKYLPQAQAQVEKYYGLASAGLTPYTQAGTGFLQSLQDLYTSPTAITQQPGYQFQMSEGLRGISQQGSALGKYFSGQTGRAMEQFAAGQAGTSYLQQLGMLGQLTSGLGVSPATSLAQMGMGAGQTLASGMLGTGQNLAQLYASQGVNQANMQNQFLSNLVGTGAMMYMFSDRRLKKNIKFLFKYKEHNIYSFSYINGANGIGVMADEVEKIKPEAVTTVFGYKMVNYGAL